MATTLKLALSAVRRRVVLLGGKARGLLASAARWIRRPQVLGGVAEGTWKGMLLAAVGGLVTSVLAMLLLNAILLRGATKAFHAHRSGSSYQEVFVPPAQSAGKERYDIQFVDSGPTPGSPELRSAPFLGEPPTRLPPRGDAQTVPFWSYIIRRHLTERFQDVALIQVRLEELDDGPSLIADVGVYTSDGWQRLAWWQFSGLAPSPEIAKVSAGLLPGVVLSLTFPTSVSSLATWFKAYWDRVAPTLGIEAYSPGKDRFVRPKDMLNTIGPELERVLLLHFEHVPHAVPVTTLRITNGIIQLLTMAAFAAALIICLCRWFVLVFVERPQSLALDAGRSTSSRISDEAARVADAQQKHRGEHGVSSGAYGIWHAVLLAYGLKRDFRDVIPFLDSVANEENERRASTGFHLRFLVGAIPALGFIGTVVGIGDALMGTGAVLSDQLAKQQSGVSTIALSLGVAFDTTFVALVLALTMTLLMSWLTRQEEGVVSDTRRRAFYLLAQEGGAPPSEDTMQTVAAALQQRPVGRAADRKTTPASSQMADEMSQTPVFVHDGGEWQQRWKALHAYDRPLLYMLGLVFRATAVAAGLIYGIRLTG